MENILSITGKQSPVFEVGRASVLEGKHSAFNRANVISQKVCASKIGVGKHQKSAWGRQIGNWKSASGSTHAFFLQNKHNNLTVCISP